MTILISSANKEIRERWQHILQSHHQLVEVSSAPELTTALKQQGILLVLLHRSMVNLDFITTIQGTPVFVLSDAPDDNEAYSLLRMGAIGYANSYMAPLRLQEAVRIALSGKVWVGQKLMQKIIHGATATVHGHETHVIPTHNLSEREWEVALRVSKGQSNLAIAAEMDISERTVKAHIGSIFKKTNTESRLQLALYVKALLSSTTLNA